MEDNNNDKNEIEKSSNETIIKFDTHFYEYVENCSNYSLHPEMKCFYNTFPNSLKELRNMIFYGPSGVGKYTQVLQSISKYSPSKLKYEKKISITFNKNTYFFKISDIHYEIDMSLLKCNSKLLWNELYNQVIDIIHTKHDKCGIIICKNFNNINNEFLDTFYSYMQNINGIHIIFIIITENISFIPDNIVNRCRIIRFARPSKDTYIKSLGNCFNKNNIELNKITNIKNIIGFTPQLMCPHEIICNKLIKSILDIENMNFQNIRNELYDIFIYNLDVSQCLWYIIHKLLVLENIKNDDISDIMKKTYNCLQYYNNNYRPIYHLESFLFYLIKKIHGF